MSEKLLKDSISAAPKRPQKLGNVQTIVRNEDIFKTKYDEITLSDDDEDVGTSSVKNVKCATCQRDMTLWGSSRRDVHTRNCKQLKEGTFEKKRFTETIEKPEKPRFVEPKPPKKPSKPPISPEAQAEFEKTWELSKNNVQFSRIAADDEANRKRKRPRSFAVVELAPKKCECEVVTTLHTRFMDEFHFKSLKIQEEKKEGLSEHAFQMSRMIEKLNRFEQLSSDMQKVLEDTTDTSPTHFVIKCSDGDVKCHKLTVKHRTTLLRTHPSGELSCEKTSEVVKCWLTYVYTARMEWNEEHVEDVRELAVKYGPVGLEGVIKDSRRKTSSNVPDVPKSAKPVEVVALEVPEAAEVLEASQASEATEVPEPAPEEPDVFTSDDPFIGFGKVVEEPEDPMILEEAAPSSTSSTPQKRSRNATMDSFDDWSNQSADLHSRSYSSPLFPINTKTPIRNAPKPVFGSHVRILKTNDVTPMPGFDKMDEVELKERMKEIGMRPKGKKAMIQMLKKAYTTLHPQICTDTPTIRPLIRDEEGGSEAGEAPQKVRRLKKTLSERLASPKKLAKVPEEKSMEEEEEENEGDKTLNISNDERDIGRICGDDVIGDDEEEEETGPSTGKKDLDGLRESFLKWLRAPQNEVLHEHILSLQPVSLEEMLIRLEKADGPLGRIGKAKLVKLLELLKITYQLPQKNGARRAPGGGAKFKKRF